MAFPVLGTTAKTTASGASLAVTMPASIVVGNLLVVIISGGENTTTRAATGWTRIFNSSNSGMTFSGFAAVAVGSDTCTITGGANTTHVAVAAQISGTGITAVNLTSSFPQSALGTLNSTACPSLSPTAGSQDYLWLAVAGSAGGAYTAGPSGFSTAVIQGTNPCAAFSSLGVTTGTESPGSFAGGGSNQLAVTVAIPPPAVVVVPRPVMVTTRISATRASFY